MVDTLAFLKKDYTEEEIHNLIDEINTYVTFFGGYGAAIMKTTDAAIYREKKDDFEIPEDIIISKLSADMLVIQQILDEKEKESREAFYKFMSSEECKELMKARNEIADNYLLEHGGYNIRKYEPNKYVINARLNMGAYKDLASLLENMGIEYADIVHWWNDEFDQETAFEYPQYEPKQLEMHTYNYWMLESYSDDEMEDVLSALTDALKQTRYGLYHLSNCALRATSNTIVKVPVLDEYKKFKMYERKVRSELMDDVISSGKFDDKKFRKVETAVKKEADKYCKTHHIFDERTINQGQIVLQFSIIDEDAESVRETIENAGYSLAFYSIYDYESMADENFERI